MALSPFNLVIGTKSDDLTGFNVIPNAPYEIRNRLPNGDSGTLVNIFEDSAGTIPITQTGATVDSRGSVTFYAEAIPLNAEYNNGASIVQPIDVGISNQNLEVALINNLSQAYDFESITALAASTIDFPLGKVLTWGHTWDQSKGRGVVVDNNIAVPIPEMYTLLTNGNYLFNLSVYGNTEFKTPSSFPESHMLITAIDENPCRIHQEPSTNIDSGTVTKYDWMLDPYDSDPINYRIQSVFNYTGDPNGLGESGVAVWQTKNEGHNWGNWTSMHFGFQDDSSNGVPMKMYLIDHSSPQWFTPAKGGWREGKSYSNGDYITASFKVYQAQNTGTSGATVPVHTSGTVSDGGINWLWIHTPIASQVKPCVTFGDRNLMPRLGFPNIRVQFQLDIMSDWGIRHRYIDNAQNAIGSTGSSGNGTDDYYDISTGGGGLIRYHQSKNLSQRVGLATTYDSVTYSSEETQPSIAGQNVVIFNNSNATGVTRFLDGAPFQEFTVFAENSLTSINQGTFIKVEGGTTVVDDQTGIKFMIMADGLTARQIR